MNNSSRAWLAIITGIIAVMIVMITMPTYKIEPKGIFLPSGAARSPFIGQVQIYIPRTSPFFSQTVGTINIRYHTNNETEQTQTIFFNKLRELAAQGGANGVVYEPQATGLTSPGPMQVLMTSGATAVYSPNSGNP